MYDLIDELFDDLNSVSVLNSLDSLNSLNSLNAILMNEDEMDRNSIGSLLKTDISVTDNNYVLEIEVPGINKENISITMDGTDLVVSAKMGESKTKHHFLRRERNKQNYASSVERRYNVGSYSNEDITASMNDGLLTVLLPKEVKKITDKKYINIK